MLRARTEPPLATKIARHLMAPVIWRPMDTKRILADLRSERDRINNAIAAIEHLEGTRRTQARGAATGQGRRRGRMSAAARKRLSDLLKKRWAQGKMGRKATKK